MARRTSPLKVKQHAAMVRERKKRNAAPMDADAIRERSRDKADKLRLPAFLRYQLESACEARVLKTKGEGALALRRALLAG